MRHTNRRRKQSADVHHPGSGRVLATRPTVDPPALQGVRLRCPVCRNGVTPTVTGFLRRHRDLFGLPCYNRRPPQENST